MGRERSDVGRLRAPLLRSDGHVLQDVRSKRSSAGAASMASSTSPAEPDLSPVPVQRASIGLSSSGYAEGVQGTGVSCRASMLAWICGSSNRTCGSKAC